MYLPSSIAGWDWMEEGDCHSGRGRILFPMAAWASSKWVMLEQGHVLTAWLVAATRPFSLLSISMCSWKQLRGVRFHCWFEGWEMCSELSLQLFFLLIFNVPFSALGQLPSHLHGVQASGHWMKRYPEGLPAQASGMVSPTLINQESCWVLWALKMICWGLFLPLLIILSLWKSHPTTPYSSDCQYFRRN